MWWLIGSAPESRVRIRHLPQWSWWAAGSLCYCKNLRVEGGTSTWGQKKIYTFFLTIKTNCHLKKCLNQPSLWIVNYLNLTSFASILTYICIQEAPEYGSRSTTLVINSFTLSILLHLRTVSHQPNSCPSRFRPKKILSLSNFTTG